MPGDSPGIENNLECLLCHSFFANLLIMDASFTTMESYFKHLISSANTSPDCLHITRDRRPLTLKEFVTMLRHTPAMYDITSCDEAPQDVLQHMRKIFEIILDFRETDPSTRRWVIEKNFERFKKIVLAERFLGACCAAGGPIYVKAMQSPLQKGLKKYALEFDIDAIEDVYEEFNQKCDTKVQGCTLEKQYNTDQVKSFWLSVKDHLKVFSEAILRVCHAYDMCFVRKKAFIGCFAFTEEQRNQLITDCPIDGIFKHSLCCAITSKSDSDDESLPTKKRCTLPDEDSLPCPPHKLRKVDSPCENFVIIKEYARELKEHLDASSDLESLLLSKLRHSATYRQSNWWDKTLLLMLLTQKVIHRNRTLAEDWKLSTHEYLSLDDAILSNEAPDYCKTFAYKMQPWYLCIIRNIKSRCQATARIPFRHETIDSFRRMCESKCVTPMFSLMSAMKTSHEDFNTVSQRVQAKSEIGKVFTTTHKITCPDDPLEPQTKLIMDVVVEYTTLYCFTSDHM